jgi:hypothetical protein
MAGCVVCGAPVGSSEALHPQCLAERLGHDAAGLVIALAAAIVARTIVVWAS